MKALFASSNQGKFSELREALAPFGIELESARAYPELERALPEVQEDGASYHENALIKARFARQVLGAVTGAFGCADQGNRRPSLPPQHTETVNAASREVSRVLVIADDSGLEVQALRGGPGIHSARFAGPGASAADNRAKLIHELRELTMKKGLSPPFPACFRSVLVSLDEKGDMRSSEGVLQGALILEERGQGGFGYDPLFIPEGEQRTLAELKAERAPHETHRTLAAKALAGKLRGS